MDLFPHPLLEPQQTVHLPHLQLEAQQIAQAKVNALTRIDLTRLALVRAKPELLPLHDTAAKAQANYILKNLSMEELQHAQDALVVATHKAAQTCKVFAAQMEELQDLENLITKWED